MTYIIAFLPYIIQLSLIIHVIKTGRPFIWLWLLVFLPFIGGLVYIILELIPDLIQNKTISKTKNSLSLKLNPDKKIQELEKLVRKQETVSNIVTLADAYAQNGDVEKAVDLYKSCLKGPYIHDGEIEFKIVKAYFYEGNFEEAKKALVHFKENNTISSGEQSLIEMQINGDFSKLEEIFKNTCNFEVGYTLAKHYKEVGELSKINNILSDMEENRKDYPQLKKGNSGTFYKMTKSLLR